MKTTQSLLSCVVISVIVYSACTEMKADNCMKKHMPFIIACNIRFITEGVVFYKSTERRVTCAKPGQPCGMTAATGCIISGDNSTAFLIINSIDCNNDTGDWYCQHGNNTPSKITMECSNCGPCVDFAMWTMISSCLFMLVNILSFIIKYSEIWKDKKPFQYICIVVEMLSVIVGVGGCTGVAVFCEVDEEAMMPAGMVMDILSAVLGIFMMGYEFLKSRCCSNRADSYELPLTLET